MPEKQTIIDLEKKFWDTMISRDTEVATKMMADKSIVIDAKGVAQIARSDLSKRMQGSKWTLDSYRMSDTQVVFPTEDTAVIGYKVKQQGKMGGKPYDMECADSSTWTKVGGRWLCALHTETVMAQS